MLIFVLALLYNPNFDFIYFPIFFVFVLLEFIFVLGKILRKKIFVPKITGRLLLTSFVLFFIYIWIFYLLLSFKNTFLFYITLLWTFLTVPLIIFFSVFLNFPIVYYKKNKKIQAAIKKSHKNNSTIKIAITWSFGKSSVKTYLSQILNSQYKTLSTPNNINTELGVSDIVIRKLKESYKYFVAETWAYKRGEISVLWRIVNHKFWFLTGIGTQHLWLFWSQENIKHWKFEILESVQKNGWLLYLNFDNDHIQNYVQENSIPAKYLRTYWLKNNKVDIHWQIHSLENAITKFSVFIEGSKYDFETALIGSHNILNLVWIIWFCFDQGMKFQEIEAWLKLVHPPKNTLEVYNFKNSTLIDDSYNLSEDGLLAWLDAAESFWKEKEIYLVLDDILELWELAEENHTKIAEIIVKNYNVKKIFFVWKNYKKSFYKWLKNVDAESRIDLNFNFDTSHSKIYLFEWKNAGKIFKKLIW